MLNITAYSLDLSPKTRKEKVDDYNRFEFIVGNKIYEVSTEVAEKISPVVANLRKSKPTLRKFNVNVVDDRNRFLIIMNLVKGQQIILSKPNGASLIYEFGKALGNKDIERAARMALQDNVDPKEFVEYINDHKKKGISIAYDLQRIANNFEYFFASNSLERLPINELKSLHKILGQDMVSKKVLSEIIAKKAKRYKNIESYFGKKDNIDIIIANRDGDKFSGLIEAFTKKIKGNPVVRSLINIDSKSVLKRPETLLEDHKKGSVNIEGFLQFDFIERRIHLNGYAIRVGNKTEKGEVPVTYALLGSNNLLEWYCIDECCNTEHGFIYPYSENYRSVYSDNEFRFIRLVMTGNYAHSKTRKKFMQLSAVEFYGELKKI